MNAKRAAAAVLATVLIVAALLVRRTFIDDEGESSNSTDAPADVGALVCATELAAVCDAVAASRPSLDVEVESANDTLDRLIDVTTADAPLWLTFDPWPAMLESLRANAGGDPLVGETTVLAASQLALATLSPERADVLLAACSTTPLWRCIGDRAGDPWSEIGGQAVWGPIRPSLGDADREAMGLASFAAAVAGYSGTASFDLSASQLDPDFTAWLRRLARAGGPLSGGTALRTMTPRPTAVNVAATNDAELAELGATSSGFGVQYPEPTMWLQVVLAAPTAIAVPDDLTTAISSALADRGWAAASTATTPLPAATTMLALLTTWREST